MFFILGIREGEYVFPLCTSLSDGKKGSVLGFQLEKGKNEVQSSLEGERPPYIGQRGTLLVWS